MISRSKHLKHLDLPVTFHKKIKSSGYGSQPTALKYSAKQKQKILNPGV